MKTKKEIFKELDIEVVKATTYHQLTNLVLYGIMEALVDIRDTLNHDTKSTK